jgi:hypothetical protein
LSNPSICSEVKNTLFSEQNYLYSLITFAMLVSAGSSIMRCSFPFTIWQIMNLIQLLKYLLLLEIYIPERIIDLIESAEYFTSSVFLPFIMNQGIVKQLLSLASFNNKKKVNNFVEKFIDGDFSIVFSNVIILLML